MKPRTLVTFIGIPLAAAGLALSPLNPLAPRPADAVAGAKSPSNSEIQVLKGQARHALIAWQNLGADPKLIDWERGGARASSQESVALTRVPSSSELASRKSQWVAMVNTVFSGKETRDRALQGVNNSIDTDSHDDFRDFGGGVSSITFTQEVLGETEVVLTADAEVWAAFAVRPESNGRWYFQRPLNREIVKFTFGRDGGEWKLLDMTASLAAGTGP